MLDRFVARLNRLTRVGRIALCGLVVLMTMPLLSSFDLDLVSVVVIGLALYAVGWLLWIGFDPKLPPVSTGAMLFLLVGLGALLLWALYYLVLLLLLSLPG
jgi:hypothetical protein